MIAIAMLHAMVGCGARNNGGSDPGALPQGSPYRSLDAISPESLQPFAPESANPPAQDAQETQEAQDAQDAQEQPIDEPPEEEACAPAPLTMQGDWAGYIYGEPEYDWDDGRTFVALLRMRDEEHGVLGFCTDMSDEGSGCATVSVSHTGDNEVRLKVDSWFYRAAHGEHAILPKDFSIDLGYFHKPAESDSEEYRGIFYSTKTPVPSYQGSQPQAVLAGISEDDGFIDFRFGKISEADYPQWYHQYDGLNGCLEGIFGFGESGADNVRTSNVFVFPLREGSFRLRYIYEDLGYPVMGDNGAWGIPEYSMSHGIYCGGYLSTYPWIYFWCPEKDTRVINASKKFASFYKNQYIPGLVRTAQAYSWEDGFEEIDEVDWGEDHYWDYLKIAMYKKLIFAAQEVIAGRFDGDLQKVYALLEKRYKPSAVKLDRYCPEDDPNAFILRKDLDMDGKEETLVLRGYRRDGEAGMPLDSAQLTINGAVFFDLHGKTMQPRIFTVDIDNTDDTVELAFAFTNEVSYSYLRLFRYTDGCVAELGGVWGKLDTGFAGIGAVAEFPGDGSIVTYVPGEGGFTRKVVFPDEQHGLWLGGAYFY